MKRKLFVVVLFSIASVLYAQEAATYNIGANIGAMSIGLMHLNDNGSISSVDLPRAGQFSIELMYADHFSGRLFFGITSETSSYEDGDDTISVEHGVGVPGIGFRIYPSFSNCGPYLGVGTALVYHSIDAAVSVVAGGVGETVADSVVLASQEYPSYGTLMIEAGLKLPVFRGSIVLDLNGAYDIAGKTVALTAGIIAGLGNNRAPLLRP